MIVFHSDLDNTLIYSYKHEIGANKRCVEIYQGREISYMTEKSYELLKRIQDKVLFVPTTTRTREQYERIDMGIAMPEYALVCNGGVLLENGVENEEWYRESLQLIAGCQEELKNAVAYLKADTHICFEIRNIKELFLFTKSNAPEETVCELRARLKQSLVEVFSNGQKVYVVPKRLDKGTAVKRFREKLQADFAAKHTTKTSGGGFFVAKHATKTSGGDFFVAKHATKTSCGRFFVIAAGDSEFDIPMIRASDLGFAPKMLSEKFLFSEKVMVMDKNDIFSDTILKYIQEAL